MSFRRSDIVRVSWATTVLFAITAAGDRAGVDALELPATITALTFFAAGLVIWMVAFVRAVRRSARERITLTGLFALVGTAPRPVQFQLLGSLALAIVVAGATASAAPFGVLEPLLPLALAGLWASRHGTFPSR